MKINFKDLFYAFLALVSCIGTYLALPWFQSILISDVNAAQDIEPAQTITVIAPPTSFHLSDTPPDAVLSPGEAWIKNGVQLVLLHENRDLSKDGYCAFSLEFTIMNTSDQEVIVAVAQTDFLLQGESSAEWTAVGINGEHTCPQQGAPKVWIDGILPGDIWNNGGKGSWLVWFGGESSPPVNSSLIVKVSNILSVDAYWKLAGD